MRLFSTTCLALVASLTSLGACSSSDGSGGSSTSTGGGVTGGAGAGGAAQGGASGSGGGAGAGTSTGSTGSGAGGATTGPAGSGGGAMGGQGPGGGGVGGAPPLLDCNVACPAGSKACGYNSGSARQCVSTHDPTYGCGDATCNPCLTTAAHAQAQCVSGACALASCDAGWADCDGNPANGCETNITVAASCGACGHTCNAGERCSGGNCVTSCTPPLTDCGDSCANLATDPSHCGACMNICPDGIDAVTSCTNGVCGRSCPTGLSACGPDCFDSQTDAWRCGGCTGCPLVAGGSSSCVGGACQATCPLGLTACMNTASLAVAPGYACVDTTADRLNCGGCAVTCPAFCENSTCVGGALPPLVATTTMATALAVDDSFVYWIESASGSIVAAEKTAMSPTPVTLAAGEPKPTDIAADGAYVYWSDNLGGAVMRKPRTGAPVDTVVATAVQPGSIAVDDVHLYWVEPPSGSPPVQLVRRAPKDGSGSGATVLTWGIQAVLEIDSIAVDPSHLCFGTSNGKGGCMLKDAVADCTTGVCTGTTVIDISPVSGRVSSDGVFLVAGGSYGPTNPGVSLFSEEWRGGNLGPPIGLWGGADFPTFGIFFGLSGFATDPRFAYFSASGQTLAGSEAGLFRAHKCGAGYSALENPNVSQPTNLAADAQYVYGISGGTSIVRFPK